MAWPDTFLATSAGESIFGNVLFENRGNGQFREAADVAGAEVYWPWGPSVGDLNADGFPDLFITTGMSYPYRYSTNSLLLNDGGTRFRDSEFVLGVEPRRGGRTAMPWFDKWEDATSKPGPNAARPTTVWSSVSSRGSILLDLDDDGDLDIVTNEFNAEPMVLLSNLSERKRIRFLKVRLIGGMTAEGQATVPSADPPTPGPRSNCDGLGAVVRVRCGQREYLQVHDGKTGYLSQGLIPLYFGLGDADTADRIEVHWPSGKKQTVSGPVKANTVVTVREP
jgi:hypothetical protein